MNDADAELVEAARRGDRQALTDLLKRHGPRVRCGLTGAIPPRCQALLAVDDVMQQTYTDAFIDIGGFSSRGDGAFAGWLATLAQRNLQDALRMLQAEKRGGGWQAVELAAGDGSTDALWALVGSTSGTPSRAVAREEAVEALTRAIDALPPLYQQVVRAFDLDGCPITELATELDRSPGAVYMLRARAHRWLRQVLGEPGRFFSNPT